MGLSQEAVLEAANQLWKAEQEGHMCAPVRASLGPDNLADAYRVQRINHERRLELGFEPIGAKIGLTSLAVQKQLGVDQPDFGRIYRQTQLGSNGEIGFSALHQPKIEAEMAFKLGKDLPSASCSLDEVMAAIDGVCASLELVGSRVENWDIRIADTVADNASASHFVLSDTLVALDRVDMKAAQMKLWKNGELVSQGRADACLGSPLNALHWLALTFAELGEPLKAGDWVLSGALGPMVSVAAGDRFTAEIEGLGSVGLNISIS